MATCKLCNNSSPSISGGIGLCLRCIRERPGEALPIATEAHGRSRLAFGLPTVPPRDPDGIPCNVCVNECRIPEGGQGYCGLRRNEKGRLAGVTPDAAKVSWYHDPLPTNCVADWVCPGGTGAGYPRYAHRQGPEAGYKNLAVFFHACSFDCLYCQNWQFKELTGRPETVTAGSLVATVDERTSCVCYFGGDPTPQLPFALRASRLAREAAGEGILRICWETNGSMHGGLLDRMAELTRESGGVMKFDLKAWDEALHRVLTGVTNGRTLENFRRAANRLRDGNIPTPLVANTLLVPGYVDEVEVAGIAGFIASLSPDIPYSLIAFHPCFEMTDLPTTSRSQAEKCLAAAREAGLRNVRIGNVHLLS